MSTAVRFEHVSKRFTLHHQRPRSFQDLVIRFFERDGGSLDKPLGRGDAPGQEEFWALRDVTFAVDHGETVGIIGPNGAGKSTALKLISRIIEPTSGEIEVNGRVGALLELGAGFHPDLSGRENIYLNGSILGLGRKEIHKKLRDIITFAELERFIDMPIRHYSSGMRMRLGFSVAAHMDPEILLVDEVLAVGDENFQHKCLDRIMEMRQQGVTICFVSHGLGSVRRLCSRAIWLNDGVVWAEGGVDDVISAYLRHAAEEEEGRLRAAVRHGDESTESEKGGGFRPTGSEDDKQLEIDHLSLVDETGGEQHIFRVGEPWAVQVQYRSHRAIEDPGLGLAIQRNDGLCVWESSAHSSDLGVPVVEGEGTIVYRVGSLPLMEGTYSLSLSFRDQRDMATLEDGGRPSTFRVRQVGTGERYGLVSLQGSWEWKGEQSDVLDDLSSKSVATSGRDDEGPGRADRRWGAGDVQVIDVSFVDGDGTPRRVFETGESWAVRLRYQAHRPVAEPIFGLAIHRDDGVHVCGPNTLFGDLDIPLVEGPGEMLYRVDHLPLLEGSYLLSVSAHNRADTVMYDYHDRLYAFRVCQFKRSEGSGVIALKGEWSWAERSRS